MSVVSSVEIPRKIWTRDDTRLLVEIGFPNAEKLELIDGETLQRTDKSQRHALWQNLIQNRLQTIFGSEYVQTKPSIYVSAEDDATNEPEPDLIVTSKSIREFKNNPTPADTRLLIEVADSTLSFDLGKKARLYARAAIVEYWVVDIPSSLVHVHLTPAKDTYASVVKYRFDENISPLADRKAIICLDRL
jgi:hypothetical protein